MIVKAAIINTYKVGILNKSGKVYMNTQIDADSAEVALRKFAWMYKFKDNEDYDAVSKTFRGCAIVIKEYIIDGVKVDGV